MSKPLFEVVPRDTITEILKAQEDSTNNHYIELFSGSKYKERTMGYTAYHDKCIWHIPTLIGIVAKVVYSMAPLGQPRFGGEILASITKDLYTIADPYFDAGQWTDTISIVEIFNFLKTSLESNKNFLDLNLTQREYESGVSINSPDREEFHIVSACDYTPWMDDFVDLGAFMNNLNIELLQYIMERYGCDPHSSWHHCANQGSACSDCGRRVARLHGGYLLCYAKDSYVVDNTPE